MTDRESAEPLPPAFPALQVIDLAVEGGRSTATYRNIVVNQVNDHCLRLSTFEGIYPWHVHPDSDELFIVVSGELAIDLSDGRTLLLAPWQLATIPAGVAHRTRTIGRVVNLTFEDLAAATTFLEKGVLPV